MSALLAPALLLIAGQTWAWTYDAKTNRAVHREAVNGKSFQLDVAFHDGHPYLDLNLSACCFKPRTDAPQMRSAVLVDRGDAIKTVVHHCEIFREYPYIGGCVEDSSVAEKTIFARIKLDKSAIKALRKGERVGLILWTEGVGKEIAWLSLQGSSAALGRLKR
jgi:hypothetical protein